MLKNNPGSTRITGSYGEFNIVGTISPRSGKALLQVGLQPGTTVTDNLNVKFVFKSNSTAQANHPTFSGTLEIVSACCPEDPGRHVVDEPITAGRGEINTVSGDISVAVPAGIGVYLDLSTLSGDARSDLEPAGSDGDAGLSLVCRSVSGDVRVIRAAAR